MENLVTSPAEIKLPWRTALWAANHVDDCSLNVDVASQGVNPARVRRDVFVHERKHDEHDAAGEAKDDVHDAAHLPELSLVELRHQGHEEAANASDSHHGQVDGPIDVDLFARHGVVQNWHAGAVDED